MTTRLSRLLNDIHSLTCSERSTLFEQSLGALTLRQALDLVQHLEDQWDVEASPTPPTPTQPEPVVEPPRLFQVRLLSPGQRRVHVIRGVRQLDPTLTLMAARRLVDRAPVTLLNDQERDEADRAAEQLRELGAEVEVQ